MFCTAIIDVPLTAGPDGRIDPHAGHPQLYGLRACNRPATIVVDGKSRCEDCAVTDYSVKI